MLVFDPDASGNTNEALRGVFVPRETARSKAPPRLLAWFGLDAAGLTARGVKTGAAVLGLKRAARLAGTRVTGRSSDDRTGSTALVLAARKIDPATLNHKVILVWTTGEEGGLLGARAFAARSGAGLRRVYAIDTFVSSDTPLEQPTFAYAPLGKGAVLRGLDDGSIASCESPRPTTSRCRSAQRTAARTAPRLAPTEHRTWGSAGPGAIPIPQAKCWTSATWMPSHASSPPSLSRRDHPVITAKTP